jgi:hypothetical protein
MVEHIASVPAEQPSKSRIFARWFGVLGPPSAAFAQQQLAYSFVDLACAKHAPLLVHLPLILAIGVTGWAAALAWREWPHESSELHAPDDPSPDSRRFFSALGLILSAISLLLIVAQWLPALFIHPCQL